MTFRILAAGWLAVLVALPVAAHCAEAEPVGSPFGQKVICMDVPRFFSDYSLDERLVNCTAAIASGQFQGEELAWLYIDRGTYHLRGKDLDRSIEDYSSAIATKPDSALAFADRGAIYYLQGKLDLALADLDRAVALNPGNSNARLNRCKVYRRKAQYDLALTDCNMAVTLNPRNPLVYQDRANLFEEQKLDPQAKADFSREISLDPSAAPGYRGRAKLEMFSGDYAAAVNDFSLEIRHGPINAGAYHMRCLARAFAKEDFEDGLADCNRYIGQFPSVAGYFARGYLELQFGHYAEAIQDFDRADECHCALARYGRGLAKRGARDETGAAADLAAAIALSPAVEKEFSNPETLFSRGISTSVATKFTDSP